MIRTHSAKDISMNISRRILLHAGAAVLLGATALPAAAERDWPARPVRIVTPYGAGGSNDSAARILAEHLGQKFGQQFVIENKPGAGTRIANEAVARSAPDGYTLLFAAAPFATAEALYGKLSYDPRKDLQPVSLAVTAPVFLIVNAASPFRNVQDLIAYGKSRQQGLTFASPGVGSGPHLAAELLFREAGVKGLNVHYRGDATAYTELLAGRVDATLTAITTALPHIQAGKLRVLGVASGKRSPIYPEAPTLGEQGLPGLVGYGWFGFLAPASTPRPILQRLESGINEALADPAVKQKLLAQGLEPHGGTGPEFGSFIQAESRKWGEVIQKANIKAE